MPEYDLAPLCPMLCAARTNSRSLIPSTSPRTILAVCIQLGDADHEDDQNEDSIFGAIERTQSILNSMILTSSSGNIGRARNRSVKRIKGPFECLYKTCQDSNQCAQQERNQHRQKAHRQ
ncbi:MAG: hypothetical protein CM1200mP20_05790 [Pseudomonadota bacterium]|nr:MAG: hypothetical protein CM1200mP20_05790 [Pseudomonadota bacterium]